MWMMLLGAALAGEAQAVEAALNTWSAAADARDVEALRQVLHPSAVQVVMLDGQVMPLDTGSYLSLLEGGKIGGSSTTVTVHRVDVQAPVATARVTRETPEMVFEDAVSLIQVNGRWMVAEASVAATKQD